MAGMKKENTPTSIHPVAKQKQAKATCLPSLGALTSSAPKGQHLVPRPVTPKGISSTGDLPC